MKTLTAFVLLLTLPCFAGRSFNGTTDVLTLAGNGNAIDLTGQKLTVSMWLYIPSLPGAEVDPMGKCQAAAQCQYLLFLNEPGHANQLGFYVRDQVSLNHDQFVYCTTVPTTSVWHNFVAAMDFSATGNNMLAYLDGVQCGANAVTNVAFIVSLGANLWIGGSPASFGNGPATHFAGRIAETAIWAARLSAGEVQSLATGQSPANVNRSTLVGYWPLLALASPEPDLSGNLINAVLTGTTAVNHCPCRAAGGHN